VSFEVMVGTIVMEEAQGVNLRVQQHDRNDCERCNGLR